MPPFSTSTDMKTVLSTATITSSLLTDCNVTLTQNVEKYTECIVDGSAKRQSSKKSSKNHVWEAIVYIALMVPSRKKNFLCTHAVKPIILFIITFSFCQACELIPCITLNVFMSSSAHEADVQASN